MNRGEALGALVNGKRIRLDCWQPGYWLEAKVCPSRLITGLSYHIKGSNRHINVHNERGTVVDLPLIREGWELVEPAVGSNEWAKEQCDAGRSVQLVEGGSPSRVRKSDYVSELYIVEQQSGAVGAFEWDFITQCINANAKWELP